MLLYSRHSDGDVVLATAVIVLILLHFSTRALVSVVVRLLLPLLATHWTLLVRVTMNLASCFNTDDNTIVVIAVSDKLQPPVAYLMYLIFKSPSSSLHVHYCLLKRIA